MIAKLRASEHFPSEPVRVPDDAVERLIASSLPSAAGGPLLYLSFFTAPRAVGERFQLLIPDAPVDNFFRLQANSRHRRQDLVVTVGLRRSRFAAILFWEALHVLAPGAFWLDIDREGDCGPGALSGTDFLDGEYFRAALDEVAIARLDGCRARLLQLRPAAPLVARDAARDGWTFGILTAGESPTAARLIHDIFAAAPENAEIIVCGPMPAGAPQTPRLRRIDLDRPEPRGWISRKKNLIVDAAAHQNVCLLHDRFVFPPNFFDAMARYGPVFSVLTFPQFYFPEASRSCFQRYADYQALMQSDRLRAMLDTRVFDPEEILYLRYDDFAQSAFCCGGVYVARKEVWNMVRQDEALFHCEWEDAVFGLQCQRAGIPHRVNPFAYFESTTPHPLALTRLHRVLLADGSRQSLPQTTPTQAYLKENFPNSFKPIINLSRRQYFGKVVDQLNRLDGIRPVRDSELEDCPTVSDLWKLVLARLSSLAPAGRQGVAEIYELITRNIYNFHNCVVTTWIADHERAVRRDFSLLRALRDAVARLRAGLGPAPGQSMRYRPFVDLIHYYQEVEAQFPVLFSGDSPHLTANGAPAPEEVLTAMRREFQDTEIARQAFFVRHCDTTLPRVEGFASGGIE